MTINVLSTSKNVRSPVYKTRARDCFVNRFNKVQAGLAQLVEQLICNQCVTGSNPVTGSILPRVRYFQPFSGLTYRGEIKR